MARTLAAPRRRERAGGDGAAAGTVLANYATPGLASDQRLSSRAALAMGGCARALEYGPRDLDPAFRRRNAAILAHRRGGGYWIWKPYVIRDALTSIGDDEMLFYLDVDLLLVAPLAALRAEMLRDGIDVVGFRTQHAEHAWTKRDCFVLMDCDQPPYRDTPQIRTGFSAWRRTPFAMAFVEEWLRLVQDERLATDLPSRCGLPDHPAFREHRHDQSVFSLLCKKRGVATRRWPPYVAFARETPLRTLCRSAPGDRRLRALAAREAAVDGLRALKRRVRHALPR